MPSILAYHRPISRDEAKNLLTRDGHRALAGGTVVVPQARQISETGIELVDLQALGLDGVQPDGDRLRIGAMERLGDIVTDDRVSDTMRDAARRELPSALRNQATLGGTVAHADADSLLVAALLIHDAQLEFHDQESDYLRNYLAGNRSGLIVAVTVETGGRSSIAATGRTPADTPIVAALARSTNDGIRLALTGVSNYPVEANAADPTAGLNPVSDFRGSSKYRRHLAAVLSSRVLQEVQ